MKRLRLYLDTSVISHLSADDVPEKMSNTLTLWDMLKNGLFTAVVSSVTLEEIEKCPEPKRELLLTFLAQIDFENVKESAESITLANNYLDFGVLKEKSKDDLRHIALATVTGCDYIVSWNFKHFVNISVIKKVQAVNKFFGYNEICIYPPTMIVEGE